MARIVVGVDGSPGAERALGWAVEESRLRDATVEAVGVYYPPESYALLGSYAYPSVGEELEHGARQRAEATVAETIGRLGTQAEGVKIERMVIRNAHPARALVDAAADADLLVVGSRGRGGFAGLLLGSVSQQAVTHAKCPVVVIPPEHR